MAREKVSLLKMEEKDRVIKPKPKLTKAERREKQERERAAKASARIGEQGQQQGAGPGNLPGVKQANASTPPGRPGIEAGQVVTT